MFYSWSFVLLLLFAAVIAGFFGALLGVGGGIFIVPVMVLMFHEVATTIGALSGSVLALYLKDWLMLLIFAIMLAYMGYAAFATRNVDDERIAAGDFARARQDRLSAYLNLHGSYYDEAANRVVNYVVTGAPMGLGVAYLAG